MRGTGEADRPNRVSLAIAYYGDDRHGRKIRWLAGNYRGHEKGQR
jgi:hypothetical protein